MSDTQWPRYEVFKQDNPKKAHEAVGSIHAADPEMALLNARDVFVRRPSAVSLWAVPAKAILSMTAEELAANPDWDARGDDDGETAVYYICTKTSQRRSMTYVTHVGEVEAKTAVEALKQALTNDQFEAEKVYVWWVFAKNAIASSDNDDIASMFAPAIEKTYRQQNSYGFVSPARKARGANK